MRKRGMEALFVALKRRLSNFETILPRASRFKRRAVLYIGLLLGAFALAGCAQTQLRERSTSYSYTFGDMEDRIVLENIARFIDDRDRLPSMADFKQGQVQATDNVSLGATLPFSRGLSGINIVKNPAVFNVGAVQTQSQDNWTYVPVTDVEDLVRTRCLYKYVIVQFEQPDRHRSKQDWIKFTSDECSLGGLTPAFGYAPPVRPWLVYKSSDEAGSLPDNFLDPEGRRFVFLGIFRSHALWGEPKSFHDFQLALLGSIPNTAGSSAAGTGPAPTKPAPQAGQFLLQAELTQDSQNYDRAGQTLTVKLSITNTTQQQLSNIRVTSRFTIQDKTCLPAGLNSTPANCVATLVTTQADVDRGSIEDLITAYANQSKSTDDKTIVLSSAVDVKILMHGAPRITTQGQPAAAGAVSKQLRDFEFVFPPFSPGKASGPVAPPLAAPAQ